MCVHMYVTYFAELFFDAARVVLLWGCVCACVCMYVCMYVCIYTRIYVFACTQTAHTHDLDRQTNVNKTASLQLSRHLSLNFLTSSRSLIPAAVVICAKMSREIRIAGHILREHAIWRDRGVRWDRVGGKW
jgi:hypothetical protein